MTKKTKLELTWPGKEERPKLEPRILIEDPDKSYEAEGAGGTEGAATIRNMLIKGDNLLALKALEAEYGGKVKCVFIDPPYNTGSAFDHYDDGVEHSLWLSLMRDRLEIIKRLLSPEGSLWITIDDNESHYLKVLCDEVFERRNFIANIVWQKRTSRENRAAIGSAHDHILLYGARPAVEWKAFRNQLPPTGANFSNPDNDPRGDWKPIPFTAQGFRANQMYEIETPAGKVVKPPRGRCWGATRETFDARLAEGRVYFGKKGDAQPTMKRYRDEDTGLTPMTWWKAEDFGDNTQSKREILALFDDENPFGTPKPEKLLNGILQIATDPGDIVLDSFAGSGTTGAVAQKMGRRWIMVELGDHAETLIVPRLKKVIEGEDHGGISEAVEWKGGGGFRYYTLAPSLMEKDKWGNWVIAENYNPAMLARAMCKHLGFDYAPSENENEWWRHGQSSETDFLYVTTQSLTRDALKLLSDEVGEGRSLMICAPAFSEGFDDFENLSCRKIPAAILAKCEWGRDDYSLNVTDPAPEPEEMEEGADDA